MVYWCAWAFHAKNIFGANKILLTCDISLKQLYLSTNLGQIHIFQGQCQLPVTSVWSKVNGILRSNKVDAYNIENVFIEARYLRVHIDWNLIHSHYMFDCKYHSWANMRTHLCGTPSLILMYIKHSTTNKGICCIKQQEIEMWYLLKLFRQIKYICVTHRRRPCSFHQYSSRATHWIKNYVSMLKEKLIYTSGDLK